jgi:hypothetical protein
MQQLLTLTNDENTALKNSNTDLMAKFEESKQKLNDKEKEIKDLLIQVETLSGKNKVLQ